MRFLPALALACLLGTVSCETPRQQAAIAQALNDASTAVNGIQADVEQLQQQVDSLRGVVARQDTTIRKLANLAHLPIP